MKKSIINIFIVSLALGGCTVAEKTTKSELAQMMAPPPSAAGYTAPLQQAAIAVLQAMPGALVNGTIHFTQIGDQVEIVAEVSGLTPGAHGFHIYEKSNCDVPDTDSAGAHFNPAGKAHGGPADSERHAGDLGNLMVGADGKANLQMKIGSLRVNSTAVNGIVGRSIMISADTDDLRTQPAGKSGQPVACGVIGEVAGTK